jgi:hypothetical protein
MPFKKKNGYYTHKGRKYTPKQVRTYYATGGFKRKPRKPKK